MFNSKNVLKDVLDDFDDERSAYLPHHRQLRIKIALKIRTSN